MLDKESYVPIKESYVPILESCIIGIAAGFSAVLLGAGINWLGALRVHFSELASPMIVLPAFGLVGGLVAGLLVERVAPEASGSGIPQVRASLDRIIMALDFRVALVKLLGGTIALGSGLFLGREGPTVQLGAALAAPLTRWLPTTMEHKRQLIAAGAGAGLTAAFNAPLAGVTFVLEELLKEIKASTIIIALIACSVSCFVLNLFSPPHLRHEVGALAQIISFSPGDVPFYLLLGAAAGLWGAIFNSAIIGALNLNREVLKVPVTIRVGLAGLVSGIIIAILPETFHNYAGMRALIVSGQEHWHMVLIAFLEFYLLTLIAYGSGAPGGLFAPALTLGSALGFLIGILEQSIVGTGSPTTFALVGMGAFASAVARTPLTAIVITFEMTANFAVLIPLMFACVVSSAVGELFQKDGLYEHLMRWNGIYLRGPDSAATLHRIKALSVMHKHVETCRSDLPAKEVLEMFGESTQRGLLVTEKGKLIGIISQSDLNRLDRNGSVDSITAADIMTPHPVAVSPYDTLDEILFLFSRHRFSWLPVTHADKPKGIILQSDVLKAVFENEEEQAARQGNAG